MDKLLYRDCFSVVDVISRRDDPEENMPPRSGRKIRFESDIEPIVAEKPAINGGLLRAPTPYPKELRAMAKHASHIRQTKTLNGEAINVQVSCSKANKTYLNIVRH